MNQCVEFDVHHGTYKVISAIKINTEVTLHYAICGYRMQAVFVLIPLLTLRAKINENSFQFAVLVGCVILYVSTSDIKEDT